MALFAKEEYLDRLKQTKARMGEAGIDVLVSSDPANMNYLAGYDGWSFYVPQCVVVSLDADTPIWIGRNMDVAGARHTTFLPESDIIGYPENYVQTLERHPMNFVGDVIAERGWGKKTVGVEMDAYYFSARGYAELQKHLPDARFANADLLVNWVRLVKSDAEIALMREAGQIANRVMTTAIDRLEPGVRECDAVAAVYQAQMSGTAEFGGDYPAIVPMMPTGEKTSAPHLTWTDAPYENEQMVNLELAACRHRYHCPSPARPTLEKIRRPSWWNWPSARWKGSISPWRPSGQICEPRRWSWSGANTSPDSAWKKSRASAMPWGSIIRRIGESTPPACAPAIRPF